MLNGVERTELLSFGRALVLMANVDGRVTADERATITRVAQEIGLSGEDSEIIWNSPSTEAVLKNEISTWSEPAFRRALAKDLVLVAYADGDFSPEERRLLDRLRPALRVDATFLETVEAWVKRGIAWQQEGVDLCLGEGGR